MILHASYGWMNNENEHLQTAWELGKVAAFGLLFAGIVKVFAGRERPNSMGTNSLTLNPGSFSNSRMSFPSGHSTQTFSVAGVLLEKDLPFAVKILPIGLGGLAAWSRIHGDRHWFSDVVAGSLPGFL